MDKQKPEENTSEENKTIRVKLVRHVWPDEIAAKKKKQKQIMVSILAGLLLFVSGFALSSITNPSYANTSNSNSKFASVHEIMNNMWYFGKDMEDLENVLVDGAIQGMVNAGGDIHTQYMDVEYAKKFMTSLEGTFVGVGVSYRNINGDFIVERIYNDSPAQKYGMESGDILRKVDGANLEGLTSDEVGALVKGEAGTTVNLTIERKGEFLDLAIVREEVSSSVYGYVKEDTGILEISSFAEHSGIEVENYLKLFASANVKHLIVDLRNNTGGYLTTTVDIGSLLMPKGSLVLQEETRDGAVKEYRTKDTVTPFEYENIAILVNEGTASASEVLTAALKENCDARVIGTLTYGKGTVQRSIPFKDGSIMKYTTAQWLTPSGNKINGIGITPDDIVELPLALEVSAPILTENESYEVDTVSEAAMVVQIYLELLGYPIDRVDGYYSVESEKIVKQFQSERALEASGVINDELITRLLSETSNYWSMNRESLDTQMIKAMEVVHGK